MDLGSTIASLRKEKGIKQKHLAGLVGVSPAYLSQVEHDHREPSLSLLRSISEELQTPLPFLFFLALDEEDVPEHKRAAYQMLGPTVQSFIRSVLDLGKVNGDG